MQLITEQPTAPQAVDGQLFLVFKRPLVSSTDEARENNSDIILFSLLKEWRENEIHMGLSSIKPSNA